MQNVVAKCTKAMNEVTDQVVAELEGERKLRENAEKRVAVLESMNEIADQQIAELEGERQARKDAEMRVATLERRVLCVVCLERERSVQFLPCFHIVSCDVCQYGVPTCPVCRTPVNGQLKAILA